jgi:two-component system, OmpR family, sensor histidine kinase BaeS
MPKRGDTLAVRLTLSFVAVAVLAVAIGAALVVALSGHDINVMIEERRSDLTRSLAVDAASTYNSGQAGWSDADLRPALELASQSGTDVAILDNDGHTVASTISDPTTVSDSHRSPITLNGSQIGTLVVKFNHRGLVASADNLRSSLSAAVIGAAGLAALLALVSGLLIARRLSRPVDRLIVTAQSMAAGDRNARVGELEHAPYELRELGGAFDHLADTLAREAQVRRGVVADVAHELRTPIAILQANTEALLDGVVVHTPAQTMSLHEEVIRLAVMVDDLQSLASAEAAVLDLHLAPCALDAVVADTIRSLAVQVASADLTLAQELRPTMVNGDAARLRQVTTNIISNSIKFTPPGGTITVTVTPHDPYGQLVIADTGIGIAQDDLAHVFERFWRGRRSNDTEGSGIGLAVVSELVDAHHGTIDIASSPDTGTTVVVVIPAAPAADEGRTA